MNFYKKTPAGFCDPRALAKLSPEAPLCVALSGGADSVALLSLLAKDPLVSAVHVHHGIRGAEADRDEAFCRQLTERLGIPLTVLHIDAPALAKARGISLETAARDGRYDAIAAHLRQSGIPLLVTAHHAGDQLETMLQHLLRGSGLSGLCGIPACRTLAEGILVARPLLTVTKDELRQYLSDAGLDFVEDSTNADPCCTRNRLRLEVVPLLEQLYGGGVKNAARCAALLAEDEAYLQALAADFLKTEGDEPSLAALAALPRPVFARVMHALLPALPEQVHVSALWDLCRKAETGATLHLPKCRVTTHGGRLTVLSGKGSPTEDYELPLACGVTKLPALDGTAILCKSGEACELLPQSLHKHTTCISLSAATIKGGLRLRNRRVGDRILHEGMHKPVRRLATHLPAAVRAAMPLVIDDAGIVAVPFAEPHQKGGALLRDGAYAKEHADLTLYLYFNDPRIN
jgi:tRNA(Ile)-lysidine synthase